jgi:excisionase family DNA binding protein
MADRAWLTVPQVAEELQVTVDTVRRWIRAGELPALLTGGQKTGYRIARADLDAFIERRRGMTWTGKGEAA